MSGGNDLFDGKNETETVRLQKIFFSSKNVMRLVSDSAKHQNRSE